MLSIMQTAFGSSCSAYGVGRGGVSDVCVRECLQ